MFSPPPTMNKLSWLISVDGRTLDCYISLWCTGGPRRGCSLITRWIKVKLMLNWRKEFLQLNLSPGRGKYLQEDILRSSVLLERTKETSLKKITVTRTLSSRNYVNTTFSHVDFFQKTHQSPEFRTKSQMVIVNYLDNNRLHIFIWEKCYALQQTQTS